MDDDKSSSQPIDEPEQPDESAGQPQEEEIQPSQPEGEAEEQPEQPDPQPAPEPEVQEPEGEEEAPEPVSRRENLRIQQVLGKLKQNQQVQPDYPAVQTPQDTLDYSKAIQTDPETQKMLDEDRKKYGEQLYQQGLSYADARQNSNLFHTRLEVDSPQVMNEYQQLNPKSDDFHPVLADTINQMYLSTVGFDPQTDTVQNPNIRYSDYVSSVFELADEIASVKTATTRTNITKQASKTGVRPDGSKSKKLNLNQAPQNMTDEELDAVIGSAIPS